MRIRQIKPEWWRDKALMTGAKAETREFYVALWMTADDAGWFEWNPTAIAAEVYPFVPVKRRERAAESHAAVLESLEPDAPHLIRHECGHAEVPKMPQHQRVSREKRVTTHFDRHQIRCRHALPAPSPLSPRGAASSRTGKELVRNGISNARAGESSEFSQKVPRPA